MEKNEPTTVLHVENLRVYLETPRGDVHAVDDVSLEVRRGEAVALVGESGCGKSMTAMSILRLAPSPPAKVLGGTIRLHDDVDILTLSQVQVQRRRGSAAGMMFQDPSTYLNPLIRIGDQIAESLELHGKPCTEEAVDEVLRGVGLDGESVRRRYPHELSGGMKQRALLAVAVACQPKLLIADEPTTALDVTIQAQVMGLSGESKELQTIDGIVPDLRDPRPGCRFAARCAFAREICASDPPVLERPGPASIPNRSRCWIGDARYENSVEIGAEV